MPVVSALRRLRQENPKFKANLDYISRSRIARPTYQDLTSKRE
jgi:hypothetical protein